MKLLSLLYKFIFITRNKPYKPYDKNLDTYTYAASVICISIICIYIAIAGITGITLMDYIPPCILNSYTGYYCPGCGGTRSILSLLKGDIINSIIYHPIIVYTAIPGIWLCISHSIFYLQRHINNNTCHKVVRPVTVRPAYIYTGIAILVLQCVIKNLIKLFTGYSII